MNEAASTKTTFRRAENEMKKLTIGALARTAMLALTIASMMNSAAMPPVLARASTSITPSQGASEARRRPGQWPRHAGGQAIPGDRP